MCRVHSVFGFSSLYATHKVYEWLLVLFRGDDFKASVVILSAFSTTQKAFLCSHLIC